MLVKSKFEYGLCKHNGNTYFAVSQQRYTEEEAAQIFERECDIKYDSIPGTASVIFRVGRNEDGEKCAGYFIDFEHNGSELRYCPVWVFEY